MAHEIKNFDHLLGQLSGISDAQLKAHFGLYQGYVKKLNEIEERLQKADRTSANYTFGEFSELKRREATALNGSYLHQMYFENLAAPGQTMSAKMQSMVEKSFGSVEAFIADLRASAGSTPGWVLTTYSKIDKKLHNYVMFEHHIGLPAHQEIVLALDCWEHAFMIDYGTTKASYLDAFLNNICWKTVDNRLSALI